MLPPCYSHITNYYVTLIMLPLCLRYQYLPYVTLSFFYVTNPSRFCHFGPAILTADSILASGYASEIGLGKSHAMTLKHRKNVDSAEQSSFTVELVIVKHNFNVAFSNKALVIPLSRHFSMFQLWSNASPRCNCQAPLTEAPTCRELSVRSENNDDKRL